jgi:Tol biopolymer transport system component
MRTSLAAALAIVALLAVPGTALTAFPGANGRIVFDSDRDGGDGDVWTIDPDGRDPMNLTADSDGDDFEGAWSPDGRRIVFVRDPDLDGPDDFELWAMRADGSGRRQLTDNTAFDQEAAFSPSGRWIAFVHGDSDVWVMRRNGKQPRQLTGQDPAEDAVDILATYSPDGRFIAFQSTRDSTDPDVFDLLLMRADGSGETVLTSSPWTDVDPDWQPRKGG